MNQENRFWISLVIIVAMTFLMMIGLMTNCEIATHSSHCRVEAHPDGIVECQKLKKGAGK